MGIKRGVIGLGADGKLSLKLPGGLERTVSIPVHGPFTAYLVVDCSGSMAGAKLDQAKRGAEDFAKSALTTGYSVGIISFADGARVVSEPEVAAPKLATAVGRLAAGGGTNLTAGLSLAASQLQALAGQRAIVVVTDGQPNDQASALAVAAAAANAGIRIIAIGTDDADVAFLSKLATSPDLASVVVARQLGASIAAATRFLPTSKR